MSSSTAVFACKLVEKIVMIESASAKMSECKSYLDIRLMFASAAVGHC